jgi:3-hydroxyacyl-[acyl-carrier-protein] dehydratase
MRWFWIDRFVEFESGRRAVSRKAITLAEEQLDRYIPGYPLMPASLIVEGLAQTGGLLVGEHNGFRERVVLAKVGRAVFHRPAVPGDVLEYTAEVEDIKPDGAIVKGTSRLEGDVQAEIELVFAHLDERFRGVEQFYPGEFLSMLRCFGLYDVGRDAEGRPLQIPPHLLDAEQALLTTRDASS